MIHNPARMNSANWPGPDRSVALRSLGDAVDGPLDLVAVYGATSFDLFHVGDELSGSFDDREDLVRRLTGLAEETRRDFVQHGLFSGLRPTQERVEYKTRAVDGRKLLQVYCGGRGMLLLVGPDEPEEPLVRAAMGLLSV